MIIFPLSLTFPVVPEEVGQVGDAGLKENNQGDPHVVGVTFITISRAFFITVQRSNSGMTLSLSRPLERCCSVGEAVTRRYREISYNLMIFIVKIIYVLIEKLIELLAHFIRVIQFTVYWVSSIGSYRNDQTVHHENGNAEMGKK